MIKGSKQILIFLFMASSMALMVGHNMHKPSILILHSYDQDYSWVRDINVGVNRVLREKYQYQVRWHYMDTKRHPFEQDKKRAGIIARHVIADMRPDVVIAFDDDAQRYAAQYFNHDPHIKVVFSGVNNEAADYGFDKAPNVTGLLQRLPLDALRETLLSVRSLKALRHPIRLAYVGDESETVAGDIRQLAQYSFAPLQMVSITQVSTWAQWQAALKGLEGRADVILVSGYRRLLRTPGGTTLVKPREVVEWTETRLALPVISCSEYYAEDGGMLAIGSSPYEQGEVAARMALAILFEGKTPRELPIRASRQFVVAMRVSKMEAHHFELPGVYEAAARIGNKYFP